MFCWAGLVTKRRAMAELEPERETVDSEKVQPGEKDSLIICSWKTWWERLLNICSWKTWWEIFTNYLFLENLVRKMTNYLLLENLVKKIDWLSVTGKPGEKSLIIVLTLRKFNLVRKIEWKCTKIDIRKTWWEILANGQAWTKRNKVKDLFLEKVNDQIWIGGKWDIVPEN